MTGQLTELYRFLKTFALIDMQFVNVDWSNATIPIVVPPDVTVTVNCTNWLSTVPVTASSTIDNFSQNTNPAPEPATMLLFGTSLAGRAGTGLRRTKK